MAAMQLNYIANASVPSSSGRTIPVIDPSDGQPFDEIQRSNADDIDAAIRQANGEPAYEKPALEKIDVPLVIDDETTETPQMPMPEMHHATRKMSFAEVELGFSKEDAMKEACRCLRCDASV